jgi:hypothetical protein
MIEDTDHPQMIIAGQDLLKRLDHLLRRKKFRLDPSTMQDMGELIDDHIKMARWKWGVVFPKLTALVIPRTGRIALCRQDTEREGVKNLALRLVYDGAYPQEVAVAIRLAFPHFRNLADEAQETFSKVM